MVSMSPETPIDCIRVTNGYGLCTSALSASVIGRFDASSQKRQAINRAWEERYSEDATFQMLQLKGNHPVRKVLHMQSCYPETVSRLNGKQKTAIPAKENNNRNRNNKSNSQASSSSSLQLQLETATATATGATTTTTAPLISSRWRRGKSQLSSRPSYRGTDGGVSTETQQCVAREYQFCHGKMAYNRTKGREAEVDGILTGTSPLKGKMPLFPARATHQQLLGLVQRPSYPHRPAPEVPRERKWLGNNFGWEGNRGLPTPPAGRNAKDGEIWPWPSSQFPSSLEPESASSQQG